MKFDYQQHVCTVVGSRIDASVLKISDGPVVVLDLYLRSSSNEVIAVVLVDQKMVVSRK